MAIDQHRAESPRIPGIRPVMRRPGDRTIAQVLQWAALALCCVQFGCVTVEEPTQAAQPRDEGVYRTGSRLPSGASSVGAISKEEWETINIRRETATPSGR